MTCGREIGYTCSDNPSLSNPGCGEHFGSLKAFDRHLIGDDRRCLTTRQLLARGFHRKPNGAWAIEKMGEARQTSLRLRQGRPRKKRAVTRRRTRTPVRAPQPSLPSEGQLGAYPAGDSS